MADVEINESTFPDENFRNWIIAQKYGIDGILTDEEISSVTDINVRAKSIQDLKGIEIFSNLKKLNCTHNQISVLDMSANTLLEELSCGYNILANLYVSTCKALKTLECDGCQLTEIDLTNNPALEEFWCQESQLTTLDVSGCKALKYLWCVGNNLKEINVTGCDKMTKLYCSYNQLQRIDVSTNTMLMEFACYNNLLTELNVSSNKELYHLRCSHNQMTALDVSDLPNLGQLICFSNKLTSIDLSGDTRLVCIYCYDNQISGQGMDAMLESLPEANAGMNDFRVIYDVDEQNVMTKEQVEVARAKDWKPLYHVGNSTWNEYDGSTTTNIDSPVMRPSTEDIYDLQGRRIYSSHSHGLYIKKGRKITINR